MKKHTLFIYSLLLLVLATADIIPAQAQQQNSQYALYNYRNDGEFNAWLNIDIDSITYSRIDLDGTERDEIVVQEVWTPDSLYRIPMEAIDSIGFRAPEPEYKEDIFHITNSHIPYTINVEDFTLTFNTTIPSGLLPQEGQVIISDVYEAPFNDGFAGRVEQIKYNNDNIEVLCSQATLNDIFKKLVIVGKGVTSDETSYYSARKKSWSDPWVSLESQGISEIEIPTDFKLDLLGGILNVTSKKPSLIISYFVYIDDLIYSFSADAFLNHNDLSFTVAFKLSDFLKISEGASEYLTNLILGKGDQKKAEEEWYEHEFDNIKLAIPFQAGPVNFSLELAPIFKLSGDIEMDLVAKTSARQHIGFKKSGYTPTLIANPFVSLALGDLHYGYVQDPLKYHQLKAKISGSATMGLSLELKANVISKNLLQAAIGGEYDRKASGTIQFDLLDTENPIENLYDVIKDSKVEIKDYVKIKGEIGTFKYLTLSGSFDIPIKEWGSYYFVPHFSKPELPKYNAGRWTYKSPISLYSTVTKDILISCQPGLRIEDEQGKKIKDYTSTEEYQYEVEWRSKPLEINISDLAPNKTYRCYPTFSMFGLKPFIAAPYYEFTTPQKLSASPERLSLPIDATWIIEIIGGWDNFAVVISGDDDVVSFIHDDDTDARHIKIKANKVGNTNIQIEDRRTGDKVLVPISVTDTGTIKVEPTKIDFGTVKTGESKSEHFTVSNTGGSDLKFTIEKASTPFAIPEAGTEFTLVAGDTKVFTVMCEGFNAKEGTKTQLIHINSDAANASPDLVVTLSATGGDTASPDITLSSQEVYLNVGDTEQIEVTSGSGSYSVWVYAPEVANVTISGKIITIKALSLGSTIVKVTDEVTKKTTTFGIAVIPPSAYDKYAVDLGLSVKWSQINVGAVSVEDWGEHYAWGETESKSYFSWSSYDLCNGTESTITKYNSHDGKTILEPSDDAATVVMGRNWRTPTLTEMQELVNRCKWTQETLNGVKGMRVTGPNGNSIFLPFGGQMSEDVLHHSDTTGYYYVSNLSSDGEKYAPALVCYGNKQEFVPHARFFGLSIRPVFNKK